MQYSCLPHQYHVYALHTALSSAKFMCCMSLSFQNQLAPSTAAPSCSRDTLVAKELALTQTSSLGPSTHHFPCTGSSWRTLVTTSVIIYISHTPTHTSLAWAYKIYTAGPILVYSDLPPIPNLPLLLLSGPVPGPAHFFFIILVPLGSLAILPLFGPKVVHYCELL